MGQARRLATHSNSCESKKVWGCPVGRVILYFKVISPIKIRNIALMMIGVICGITSYHTRLYVDINNYFIAVINL